MAQVKSDIEAFARIRVVGVGGSGKNATNHMVNSKVKGVEFIAINTDAQDLHHSLAKKKIHIGKNLTRGLGTGMNPEKGRKAAEETKEEIQEVLKGSDMIFIAGGMGGGTGTGASGVIAKTARELGALTVGVVTKPFSFEGQQRMRLAEQGLEELKKDVDALIVIPNDRILAVVDKETTVDTAFAMCDDVLRQAVEGISDLITAPGRINADFADIRTIMENAGSALMGIGSATGEQRAVEAANAAINSPLLEIAINGSKNVLFSIAGGDDLGMLETQEAARVITEAADPNAKIIYATTTDGKLKKGEIRVTVIATGFPDNIASQKAGSSLFQLPLRGEDDDAKEEVKNDTKGKIFNSVTSGESKKKEVPENKKDETKKNKTNPVTEEVDDDWGAVPAFLRRSKLK